MMNIIVVRDKYDTHVIDATSQSAAYLALFDLFDASDAYMDLTDPECATNDRTLPSQKAWYALARAGSASDALKLLDYRRRKGYEYEDNWRITIAIEPTRKPGEARA